MLVPKLRFKREDGTYYPEWTKQKLSAVSSRVTRKNRGNITDIPLTIASLYGLVDQREYFKKKIASRNMEGYYLLHNGEFAYNKSYSKGFDFGAIKRLDRYDCGALSTLYICFAVNNKVDSDFMTHYFDSQKWNKEVSIRCAEGARNHGLLNISTNDFFDIDMVLPTDLEEQQKIADFLSNVDEVIAQSEAEVANLQQQKKAAMQKIFSQEVRFKREDGTSYPEWEELPLGQIVEQNNIPVENPGSNYVKLAIRSHCKGTFHKPINSKEDGLDVDKMYLVEANNLIVNITFAWEHAIAITKPEDAGTYVSHRFPQYKFVNGNIPAFYAYVIKNPRMKYEMGLCSPGGAGRNRVLKQNDFLLIPMARPCIEEQQKIADFLATYDEAISCAKQELDKWKELKKGLLQQMFA